VVALYEPDGGYFHGYLEAAPYEGKMHLYPAAIDIIDGYVPLKTLEALGAIDWTPSVELLRSLVNGESSQSRWRGLLNSTRDPLTGRPNVISQANGVRMFQEFGVLDELDVDLIMAWVAQGQDASGGFVDCPDGPREWWNQPDIIVTHTAVTLLADFGYLDYIDTSAVVNFVMSRANPDGGFSYSPGGRSSFGVLPLALMILDAVGCLSQINRTKTLEYMLQHWKNETGCHISEDIVSTERAIWCFSLLSALDMIDRDMAARWILSCQSHVDGSFRAFPRGDVDRLVFCRSGVHALSLLNRLDMLNVTFSVMTRPEWKVPDWYLEKVATESEGVPYAGGWPDLGVIGSAAIGLVPVAFCLLPGLYLLQADRNKRRALRAAKRRRKNRS